MKSVPKRLPQANTGQVSGSAPGLSVKRRDKSGISFLGVNGTLRISGISMRTPTGGISGVSGHGNGGLPIRTISVSIGRSTGTITGSTCGNICGSIGSAIREERSRSVREAPVEGSEHRFLRTAGRLFDILGWVFLVFYSVVGVMILSARGGGPGSPRTLGLASLLAGATLFLVFKSFGGVIRLLLDIESRIKP